MYVMTSPYWNRRTSLAVGHVDDGAQHNGRRLVAHHLSDAAAALLVLGIAAVDIDRAAVAAAGGSAAGITGLLLVDVLRRHVRLAASRRIADAHFLLVQHAGLLLVDVRDVDLRLAALAVRIADGHLLLVQHASLLLVDVLRLHVGLAAGFRV